MEGTGIHTNRIISKKVDQKSMSSTTTRLQLHLSAKNLKNLGGGGARALFGGTSDPFAVVTVRGDNSQNKPVVVGQTDVYVHFVVVGSVVVFCCDCVLQEERIIRIEILFTLR